MESLAGPREEDSLQCRALLQLAQILRLQLRLPVASGPRLDKTWVDSIRGSAKPLADIELALRAHVVLCLAEMSERLSLTLLYDEKTRQVRTGDGRVVQPITYDTVIPG